MPISVAMTQLMDQGKSHNVFTSMFYSLKGFICCDFFLLRIRLGESEIYTGASQLFITVYRIGL